MDVALDIRGTFNILVSGFEPILMIGEARDMPLLVRFILVLLVLIRRFVVGIACEFPVVIMPLSFYITLPVHDIVNSDMYVPSFFNRHWDLLMCSHLLSTHRIPSLDERFHFPDSAPLRAEPACTCYECQTKSMKDIDCRC